MVNGGAMIKGIVDKHKQKAKIVAQNGQRLLGCRVYCELMSFNKGEKTGNGKGRSNYGRPGGPFLEHREQLRLRAVLLAEQIQALCPREKKLLLKPGTAPVLSFAGLSVSHCTIGEKFTGGFIMVPFDNGRATSVGFDLEQRGRASKRVVLRIANREELCMSPSPCALWSAKESAYKSLSYLHSPVHATQISVFDWKRAPGEETYDYQFKVKDHNITGHGFVVLLKSLVIAFAHAHPRITKRMFELLRSGF